MKPLAPIRPPWLRAGAFLTLLALGLLAPAAARAGCAHPAAMPARAVIGATDLDPLILGADRAMPEAPVSEGTGAPTRPCAGASCSGAPAVPGVPASVLAPDAGQWACLGPCPATAGPESRFLRLGDDPGGPSHRGPAPFHPPRRPGDPPPA